MANAAELFKKIRQHVPQLAKEPPETLERLLGVLEKMVNLLILVEVSRGGVAFQDQPGPSPLASTRAATKPKREQIDQLKGLAAHRQDQSGKIEFLLHRATDDNEYEKSALPIENDHEESPLQTHQANRTLRFKTSADTAWHPTFELAEQVRVAKNPVISCWVPVESIKTIPNAPANTGAWGELGQNQAAPKYVVVVEAGTYGIHSELRP